MYKSVGDVPKISILVWIINVQRGGWIWYTLIWTLYLSHSTQVTERTVFKKHKVAVIGLIYQKVNEQT